MKLISFFLDVVIIASSNVRKLLLNQKKNCKFSYHNYNSCISILYTTKVVLPGFSFTTNFLHHPFEHLQVTVMNRVLIIIIVMTIPLAAITQCDQKELPDSVIYKKLNQSFSNLATGQGDAIALTNYGSFEPVNGEFKLNVFGPIGK